MLNPAPPCADASASCTPNQTNTMVANAPHFGSSDTQELRNSGPGVPFLFFPQVYGNFVLYSRLQCSPVFLTQFRQ
jgi:hypothetical protein